MPPRSLSSCAATKTMRGARSASRHEEIADRNGPGGRASDEGPTISRMPSVDSVRPVP
jgi:hypothetical protein